MPSLPPMPPRLWQLDGNDLVMPDGRRVPLSDIQDWAMAFWGGNQTIQTDRWRGWRIVQQYLVPPGRTIKNCPLHINVLKTLASRVETSKREKRVLRSANEE